MGELKHMLMNIILYHLAGAKDLLTSRSGLAELHRTLDIKWFRGQKLISLYEQWVQTDC